MINCALVAMNYAVWATGDAESVRYLPERFHIWKKPSRQIAR
jgi:hypothetical protein